MKKIALIVLAWVALGASATASPARRLHILASRMDIVQFKVDKKLIGGVIEITTKDGRPVLSQFVAKRKILIDFYFKKYGVYTIKVTNGTITEEFDYNNTSMAAARRKIRREELIVVQGALM